ncbi:MAG: SGNH/GDSL hydrolase family protein [Planctomycetota bacterium]
MSPQTPLLQASSSHSQSLRFLALGDSYTIGESVSVQERWPCQLIHLLKKEGFSLSEPEIIARTGWTTDELIAEIQQKNPQGPYSMVSLLIGVNNQYRGRSLDEYRQQFIQLLQKAIAFADQSPKKVLVLSIPDWGQTPFAEGRDRLQIYQQIDQFNQVNREETQKIGAFYLDITPITRQGLQDPSLMALDGLHPSGTMYRLWAEQALPITKKMVQSFK